MSVNGNKRNFDRGFTFIFMCANIRMEIAVAMRTEYWKCFLGFRNMLCVLDWTERKPQRKLCHGGIKAWEILISNNRRLLGFIFYALKGGEHDEIE